MHLRLFVLSIITTAWGCNTDAGSQYCNGTNLETDPGNCGDCGYSCGGGGCSMGVCQASTIVQGQSKPSGVAVDATRVVWTNEGAASGDPTGTIAWCPIDGCPATGSNVIYEQLGRPSNPILAGDKIYFVHGVLGTAGGDITGFVPEVGTFAGQALGTPLMWWGFRRDVTSLAVVEDKIYVTTLEEYDGAGNAFIATCAATGCPNNGTEPYMLARDRKGSSGIVVDNTFAFFIEFGSATILKTPRGTSVPQPLFESELGALLLAHDDAWLYWGTSVPAQAGVTVNNYLARGAKAGGMREKLADVGELTALTVAGDWIYFAEADGDVARIKKTGGAIETLAFGQGEVRSLAVGGDFLYYASRSNGSIHRVRI